MGFIMGIIFFSLALLGVAYFLEYAMNGFDEKKVEEFRQQQREEGKQKRERELSSGYRCPNCGYNAGYPISTSKKVASTATFGIASSTLGKTYECKNCKYKW